MYYVLSEPKMSQKEVLKLENELFIKNAAQRVHKGIENGSKYTAERENKGGDKNG